MGANTKFAATIVQHLVHYNYLIYSLNILNYYNLNRLAGSKFLLSNSLSDEYNRICIIIIE